MYRAAASVAALVLALSACSASDEGRTKQEAGALAAAQAYLDAIAAQDADMADAMTDPKAFETAAGPDNDVDIRAGLADAADPITDPWVSLVSPTSESRYGRVEFVVSVSYDIDELSGGGTIVVQLDDKDADPSKVDNWTATLPLIARGDAFSDLPTAFVGSVKIAFGDTYQGVWGYPGGYLLTAPPAKPGVAPLPLIVGAANAAPWNDNLPKLGEPVDE